MTDDEARAETERMMQADDARTEHAMREQTAATILAALIQAVATVSPHMTQKAGWAWEFVPLARDLADALRAELAKGKP